MEELQAVSFSNNYQAQRNSRIRQVIKHKGKIVGFSKATGNEKSISCTR